MNKDQYNYDIGVQIVNRANDIKALELKLERLRLLRDAVYRRGQQDKSRNNRQDTLIEYREQINEYDNKIHRAASLSDILKRKNGVARSPRSLPTSEINKDDLSTFDLEIQASILQFYENKVMTLAGIANTLRALEKEIIYTTENLEKNKRECCF
jgi:hypothetical protein